MYRFRDGARISGLDPEVVGRVLADLASDGSLTKEAVVAIARSTSHPLHSYFEWDDAVAAQGYRLNQARHLIASVTIRRDDKPDRVIHAFVAVERDGTWESIASIMSDDEKRRQMLVLARGELDALRRKYDQLLELMPVWQALDAVEISVPSKRRVA